MKETEHSYQGSVSGNYYSNEANSLFEGWKNFKEEWVGIGPDDKISVDDYDEDYNFLFRYDIEKQKSHGYALSLFFLMQRKGIYSHIIVTNISQKELDEEVKEWLTVHKVYIEKLWAEV